MRTGPDLLRLLCCPGCRGELRLADTLDVASDGHVMAGNLSCVNCGSPYPIVSGIPRFVPPSLADDLSRTIEGFGYEWKHAGPRVRNTQFDAHDTFLDFISPIQDGYFKDKIVLDAGCGMGRFTRVAHSFGAAKVVGLDLSQSVEVAFEHTRMLPNVLIVQGDLSTMPLRQCFDYAFSVGVLHHTPDPRRAFASVLELVKPGGGISAWVYGKEGNEWILRFINPIRVHVTSRLPRWALLAAAYAVAVPAFLILKTVYAPVGRTKALRLFRHRLFYFEYLFFLSKFGFHEQAYVIFDHLVPTIAEYIPRDEFAAWFETNGLEQVQITSRAENSWRGFGVRSTSRVATSSNSAHEESRGYNDRTR